MDSAVGIDRNVLEGQSVVEDLFLVNSLEGFGEGVKEEAGAFGVGLPFEYFEGEEVIVSGEEERSFVGELAKFNELGAVFDAFELSEGEGVAFEESFGEGLGPECGGGCFEVLDGEGFVLAGGKGCELGADVEG